MRSMSMVFAGLVLLALLVEVMAANSAPSAASHTTAIKAGQGLNAPQSLPGKLPTP